VRINGEQNEAAEDSSRIPNSIQEKKKGIDLKAIAFKILEEQTNPLIITNL